MTKDCKFKEEENEKDIRRLGYWDIK